MTYRQPNSELESQLEQAIPYQTTSLGLHLFLFAILGLALHAIKSEPMKFGSLGQDGPGNRHVSMYVDLIDAKDISSTVSPVNESVQSRSASQSVAQPVTSPRQALSESSTAGPTIYTNQSSDTVVNVAKKMSVHEYLEKLVKDRGSQQAPSRLVQYSGPPDPQPALKPSPTPASQSLASSAPSAAPGSKSTGGSNGQDDGSATGDPNGSGITNTITEIHNTYVVSHTINVDMSLHFNNGGSPHSCKRSFQSGNQSGANPSYAASSSCY
jgi:hypothetical protein